MEYIELKMFDFCYVSAQFKNKSDLITSSHQNIYFFMFVL